MIRTITHKHLKRQFDIFESTEEIEDLFTELEFSTLLIPVDLENDTFAFPILHAEDKRYAPVFTDIHEYNKFNFGENFTLMPNDFNFYLNLLDENIDGIIIDAEGERFPLTKEIKDFVNPNTILIYDSNVLTLKEIKDIKDSINNDDLEEFLKEEYCYGEYDKLIKLLLKSDLFKVVLSKVDLSSKAENGIISLKETLPTAITMNFSESYALIYTSEKEIKPKNNPMIPYLQLVNLPKLINRVLLDDLDGIILNENSQNIIIPREYLRNFMKDFKIPLLDDYNMYAFVIEEGK